MPENHLTCMDWVRLEAFGCWVSVDEDGELVRCPDDGGAPVTSQAEVVTDASQELLDAVNARLGTWFRAG